MALDYWAAKYILYPIDSNQRHHPDYPGIDVWLRDAENRINSRGGLTDPNGIILVNQVTKNENAMNVHDRLTESFAITGSVTDSESREGIGGVTLNGLPGSPMTDGSGHYSGHVNLGWKGTLRPEKNGYVFAPKSRSYSGVNSDLFNQDFVGERTLVAPLNFSGRKVMNRSLVMSEYINILNWTANPDNINIVSYRLYEEVGGQSSLLIEFSSDVFEHWIRGVDRDKEYVYALTALNSAGRESPPATITIR
ncbi:hypothetical protein ACFLT2_08830 [Acidobacteriota bacterium]